MPVLWGLRAPEISEIRNNSDRIPDLYANTIAGTTATHRSEINTIPNKRGRRTELDANTHFPVQVELRAPDINTLPNKRESESSNSTTTQLPVIGPRIEPDANTLPEKRERPPELDFKAIAGAIAASRSRGEHDSH